MVIRKRFNIKARIFMFCLLLLQLYCIRKEDKPKQPSVIAKIGSKKITAEEFRYRTKLTPRPGSIKTVNAALNNLIAEQLLALEAGDTCELAKSPVFQAHIQGIREQAMREQLYRETAVKQVRLKDEEIKKTYTLSQRVYDLEFFTINRPEIVEQVELQLSTGQTTLSDMFEYLKTQGESGRQTVKWRDPENDEIHKSLYNREHRAGEIMGPLRIGTEQWIMMRVLDFRTEPVIGPEDTQMRMHEIREKLTDLKAKDIWHNYKNTLMQGKEMRFEKEVFGQIVEWYMEEQRDSRNGDIPPPQEIEPDTQLISDTPEKLDSMLDRPFFRLNGETWTVGDFKQAIMSHPLVYRKRKFLPSQFPHYFKQAIADLIADHYLNKEAYRRGLDKHPEVKLCSQWWETSYLAQHRINQYLKEINVSELQKKDYTYYGPRAINEYLVQLNQKYASKIEIYEENLTQFDLNEVPLFVLRPGMPYPVAVPGFPHFTDADTLLFGSKDNMK
ncbi:hypothetical protein JW835_06170 [bacterium]|nr:hypothetical protein [bacterium]